MNTQNKYYAIQAITENGEKFLCWQEKKHLYFAEKVKGFKMPPPPTLFNTKKEAAQVLRDIPSKGGNLKQFHALVEAKKTKIVPIQII